MKWKFIGVLGKSTKYYITEDGHMAQSRKYGNKRKFEEIGYIDDNMDKMERLCEGI